MAIPLSSISSIRFVAVLVEIDDCTLLRLPADASKQLPSRGQVAVLGTIDGHGFQTVLEPDGEGGHWIRVDEQLYRDTPVKIGSTATLELAPAKDWPEPSLPPDFESALDAAPQKIHDLWSAITPMARWEWVRWVNATKNPDTRQRRIEVAVSKMNNGKRRPCCFDLSACTDPNLSKNGKLQKTG